MPEFEPFDVPLLFNTPPAPWDSDQLPLSLRYVPEECTPSKSGEVQAGLRGRSRLVPEIDLNDYRCTAEIDLVEFKYVARRPKHPANLQREMVRALRARGSSSTVWVQRPSMFIRRSPVGHEYRVRVQQPEPDTLFAAIQALQDRYPPEPYAIQNFAISEIEIAVDFRVKRSAADSEDMARLLRWRMVEVLRKHFRPAPVIWTSRRFWPRYYQNVSGRRTAILLIDRKTVLAKKPLINKVRRLGGKKHHGMALHGEAHHQAPVDTTYYAGRVTGPVLYRIMDKTTDRRNPTTGSATPLPLKDCRARIEINFKEHPTWTTPYNDLGLVTVDDIRTCSFEALRKVGFEFFLPTLGEPDDLGGGVFELVPSEQEVFALTGVYGLHRLHEACNVVQTGICNKRKMANASPRFGRKGKLVAYTELNQKAWRALKGLTGKWERMGVPGPVVSRFAAE